MMCPECYLDFIILVNLCMCNVDPKSELKITVNWIMNLSRKLTGLLSIQSWTRHALNTDRRAEDLQGHWAITQSPTWNPVVSIEQPARIAPRTGCTHHCDLNGQEWDNLSIIVRGRINKNFPVSWSYSPFTSGVLSDFNRCFWRFLFINYILICHCAYD